MNAPEKILEKLRAIVAPLPEARETVTFGHPTLQAGKKTFAVLEVYKGELCLVFKTDPPTQHALVQDARFFPAPYGAKHGWVSLRVGEGKLEWARIRALVLASWRLVATKRAVAAFESGKGGPMPRAPRSPARSAPLTRSPSPARRAGRSRA